jgi:hypothetical protein
MKGEYTPVAYISMLAFIKMKKTTHIVIILTFLTLIGCNDNRQKSDSQNDRFELVPEPDKDLREKYEQQQKDKLESDSIIKRIDCNEFSESMTDFIELLKQDNYAINLREDQSGLRFKSYKEGFQVDKTISFPKGNFKTIFAKRKNKLERMTDNWYPSFAVTEICLQDEQTASKSYQEISEIIDNSDLINEKDYDYILKNKNRLIYVICRAKIFEEYAFAYKDKIEEMIKNNKR